MLTASEAAKEKGVHVKSVYRAMSEGRLEHEVKYGLKLISREALAAWHPWVPGPRVPKKKPGGESA